MSRPKKKSNRCRCSSIPFFIIIAILGGSYWWFSQKQSLEFSNLLPKNQRITIPILNPIQTASSTPAPSLSSTSNLNLNNRQAQPKIIPQKTPLPQTPWEKK